MPLEEVAGQTVARTPADLRAWVAGQRRSGRRVALVPTMGALHAGHLSLVDVARQHAEAVVVTIFVNPLQFGPSEDFDRYPRQLLADAELCHRAGVGLVFAPERSAMYPAGFQTHVEVEQLTRGLCGASRPGHFRGVTTVVLKLLNLAMADAAVFGEKDWQQLQAIARMALDLDHPTAIVGAPIVREPDGLAMSSRNVYLSPDERQRAATIHRALQAAREQVLAGQRDAGMVRGQIAETIAASGGRVDYVEVADPHSLQPLDRIDRPARALVAAFYGRTRLLDNLALD